MTSADQSPSSPSTEPALDVSERIRRLNRSEPTLDDRALHGLTGEIVRTLQPLTEAAVPAMLASLLTAFCALVGRGAHIYNGREQHPRLYTLIVGASARARKGTSLNVLLPILDEASRVAGVSLGDVRVDGLSTGEGLIQAATNAPAGRLLVVEEEFGRTLGVMNRDGNTLSAVLRSGWDGATLAVLTRSDPLRVDNAHLNVIGHVTRAELDEKLRGSDIHNGLANRLLIVHSARTQLLPTPGRLPQPEVVRLGRALGDVIVHAAGRGELVRSAAFEDAWAPMYESIEGQPSLGPAYDSIAARGSTQITTLALVYALLDRADALQPEHLSAAAALWDYAEQTVAHIWGRKLDAKAQKLLDALSEAGELSRTDINRLFSNNLSAEQVDELCEQLERLGVGVPVRQSTAGRDRCGLQLA